MPASQAEEILQEHLKSKESVTDVILQTDQTLSEKEKLIESEEQVKRLDSLESSLKFWLIQLGEPRSLKLQQHEKRCLLFANIFSEWGVCSQ